MEIYLIVNYVLQNTIGTNNGTQCNHVTGPKQPLFKSFIEIMLFFIYYISIIILYNKNYSNNSNII